MRDWIVRAIGLALAAGYFAAIVWLYTRQPQTVTEATGVFSASVGVYSVDEQAFADGIAFFRTDRFAAARLALSRADPALQDARTQFYVAYSYYREGWGRFYVDRELYARGLEAVDRAIAAAPRGRIVVDDGDLQMRSGDELKAELEAGLKATDLNPLTIARRRRK